MMPFPKLLQSNPLSQQMEYERKLQRSLKSASSAVGVIVSVASKLDTDDKAVTETIARVENILGQSVHHRILRNYTMLMLFATKVNKIKQDAWRRQRGMGNLPQTLTGYSGSQTHDGSVNSLLAICHMHSIDRNLLIQPYFSGRIFGTFISRLFVPCEVRAVDSK